MHGAATMGGLKLSGGTSALHAVQPPSSPADSRCETLKSHWQSLFTVLCKMSQWSGPAEGSFLYSYAIIGPTDSTRVMDTVFEPNTAQGAKRFAGKKRREKERKIPGNISQIAVILVPAA